MEPDLCWNGGMAIARERALAELQARETARLEAWELGTGRAGAREGPLASPVHSRPLPRLLRRQRRPSRGCKRALRRRGQISPRRRGPSRRKLVMCRCRIQDGAGSCYRSSAADHRLDFIRNRVEEGPIAAYYTQAGPTRTIQSRREADPADLPILEHGTSVPAARWRWTPASVLQSRQR